MLPENVYHERSWTILRPEMGGRGGGEEGRGEGGGGRGRGKGGGGGGGGRTGEKSFFKAK